MSDIKAVTPSHFVPMLAGAVAAPLIASVVPGLNRLGVWAPLAAGAALAYFGSGQIRAAGQGAVLVAAVGLVAPMLGGLLGGGKSDNGAQVKEAF